MRTIKLILFFLLFSILCVPALPETILLHTVPQRGQWRDDGGFANSPSAHRILNGKNSGYEITFQGIGQNYSVLPELKKEYVYSVDISYTPRGQVESAAIGIRLIGSPWTTYGEKTLSLSDGRREKIHLEVRMPVSLPARKAAIFLYTGGSGSMIIHSVRVERKEDFSPVKKVDQKWELLFNSDFRKYAAGWAGAVWRNGSIAMPGTLTTESTFAMNTEIPCTLRIRGTSGLKIRYIIREPEKRNRMVLSGETVLKKGAFSRNILIPQPRYGRLLDEPIHYSLTVIGFSQGKISEISLRAPGERKRCAEYAVLFDPSIAEQEHNIPFGGVVKAKIVLTGVSEGQEFFLRVSDSRGRLFREIPFRAEVFPEGIAGGELPIKMDRYGWFQFTVLDKEKKFLAGRAGEIAVCSFEKNGDRTYSDFVLGAHLRYDQNYRLFNEKKRLEEARRWGFRGVRLHPPLSTKWWAVCSVGQNGNSNWNFHDDILLTPPKYGIQTLGLLDGTAHYASSAPEAVLKQTQNDWLGYGAYPAKEIRDWEHYVTRIVSHFRGRTEWEVWNEPDHSFLKLNPAIHKSREEEYMRLLKSAYRAAKKADPSCRIVAGAVTAGGRQFLLNCIENGMLDFCDAISFHGYGRQNGAHDRGAEAFQDIVSALQNAMKKRGIKRDIYDTEASSSEIPDGIAGAGKSELNLKSLLARRAAGIRKVFFYNAFPKDYPGHQDHRMILGYNHRPLVVQPLFNAYDRILGNTRFDRNCGSDSAGIHLYRFRTREGGMIYAGWTSTGKEEFWNVESGSSGSVLDQYGNPESRYRNGRICLTDSVRYFLKE